jgi:glutathione S-transferase
MKLSYFDFRGRGEPLRLALSIGGIEFEDDRIQVSDWEHCREKTPFGALPVLEVDGETLAQSNAILRYIGRLTNLYPADPWQAALCDEALEVVEEMVMKILASRYLPEDQKRAARKALVEGPIPVFLNRLEQRLESRGGRYFAGDRLSIADLKVSEFTRSLRSGALDYIPTDLPDHVAPKLVLHHQRVARYAHLKPAAQNTQAPSNGSARSV